MCQAHQNEARVLLGAAGVEDSKVSQSWCWPPEGWARSSTEGCGAVVVLESVSACWNALSLSPGLVSPVVGGVGPQAFWLQGPLAGSG